VFILDVGSKGLVKLVLILVLGGFSSTKVDLIVAAVARSFPPPDNKIQQSFFFIKCKIYYNFKGLYTVYSRFKQN